MTRNWDTEGVWPKKGFPTGVHPPMGHLVGESAREGARGVVWWGEFNISCDHNTWDLLISREYPQSAGGTPYLSGMVECSFQVEVNRRKSPEQPKPPPP